VVMECQLTTTISEPDPNNDFTRNDLNDQTDYGTGDDITLTILNLSPFKRPAAAALYGSSASNGP